MQNERCENYAEGQQNDQVAPGKWLAISQDKWDRQSASKRIGPAHAGPRDQRGVFPWSGLFTAEGWTEQTRQIGGSEHPDETNQHDHCDKHDRQPGHASRGSRSKRVHNLRQLEADEHEKYSIQNEGNHLPHRERLQAHAPAQDPRCAPPDIDARNYDSEDSGNMETFATEVGHVRRKQGK